MQPAEWSSCDLLSDLSPPAECASIGPIAACSLGSPCQRTCCLQINPPASATALQAAESDPYPASTAYPSRIRPYFSQIPSRVLRTKEINNLSCPLLPDCWSEACPAFSQLNCFTYGGWVRTPPLTCHPPHSHTYCFFTTPLLSLLAWDAPLLPARNFRSAQGDPKRFDAWAAAPRRHRNVVFIARYNENLYWLTPLLGLIDELHTGKLHLTNVQNGGRDGHSFLEFAAQYVERGDAHGLGNVFFIQVASPTCAPSPEVFISHALLITCQLLVVSLTIVLRSINARRVAHLVGSSYRGVDPTGRVSIVGDELKGRLNQTVTNFFSLLDTGAALT
ncbi:MAG: hypothetical protein SGPRY_003853 [Prymnesium sp.]